MVEEAAEKSLREKEALDSSFADLTACVDFLTSTMIPSSVQRSLASNRARTSRVRIKSCGKEEVKVIDGGQNKIVAIGKDLIEEQCLGEFIGVAKLSKDFVDIFRRSISDLVDAGGKNDYFEAGIQPLLDKVDTHFIDISEYPCLEIDFLEDLESARELFKDKR